jgi:hypothetical protein
MRPQAYTEFQPLKQLVVGRSWNSRAIATLPYISDNNKRLLTYLLDELMGLKYLGLTTVKKVAFMIIQL